MPDRVLVRAAERLRRVWLLPPLLAGAALCLVLFQPLSLWHALVVFLVFAGLLVLLSWRLTVLVQEADQRLKEIVREQERIIQGAVRDNAVLSQRLAQVQGLLVSQSEPKPVELAQIPPPPVFIPPAPALSIYSAIGAVQTRMEAQLAAAGDVYDLGEIIVRGAAEIAAATGSSARCALFSFEPQEQQLLRLAQWPEQKRVRLPGGQRSGPRRVAGVPLRFEPDLVPVTANSPAFWSIYVKKQPLVSEEEAIFDTLPDEPPSPLIYRLPLVVHREASGHLAVYLEKFLDDEPQEALLSALTSFSVSAALALAQARAQALTAQSNAEVALLSHLGALLAENPTPVVIGQFLQEQLCPLLLADVCLLAVMQLDGLRPVWEPVEAQRDLVHAEDLTECPCSKQWQSKKPQEKTGVRNPAAGECLWKKYGGVSGVHCICSVPLRASGRSLGVLAVYRGGSGCLDEQEGTLVAAVGALVAAYLAGLKLERQ